MAAAKIIVHPNRLFSFIDRSSIGEKIEIETDDIWSCFEFISYVAAESCWRFTVLFAMNQFDSEQVGQY